jgi:hypothetical protein
LAALSGTGETRVLNAVPKFSPKLKVLAKILVCETHWVREMEPVAEVTKPLCTKPTVGVGFVMSSEVAPLIEIEAMTGVAPAAEPPLNVVALARMLVKRYTREIPVVTGGRTGMPKNVTELPLTMP